MPKIWNLFASLFPCSKPPHSYGYVRNLAEMVQNNAPWSSPEAGPPALWSITELLIVASTYNDNLFLGMQDLRYLRPWLGTIPLSRRLHRVVWYKNTNNSEECFTCLFRVESFHLKVGGNLFLLTSLPSIKLHGVVSSSSCVMVEAVMSSGSYTKIHAACPRRR